MNAVELAVYNAVKSNPRLKLAIRDIYQRALDWIPQRAVVSSYPIIERPGCFFGFHDHTPFSCDGIYLASGRFNKAQPIHMPAPGETLDVGIFTGNTYTDWHAVTQTRAWNWHQGCKLQWCGKQGQLAFNDHIDGRTIARIVSVDNAHDDTCLPYPVSSVSPSGRYAVGYNFERVETYMPGYGYPYKTNDKSIDTQTPANDGIYVINIPEQTCEMVLDIRRLRFMDPEPSMEGAYHFVSHALFSPSGKRYAFLHRWIRGDVTIRWSRIVVCDLNGEDIRILPTQDMASHLGWRNERELLAYCRLRNGKDCYALFRDDDPVTFTVIGAESFNSDGHPAWSPDQRYFVTDTYPDRFRRQFLALYDIQHKKRYDLARLKTYRAFASLDPYKHWSCDLHPRWDRTGRFLCFDSSYSGQRSLCTIDFGTPVQEVAEIKHI